MESPDFNPYLRPARTARTTSDGPAKGAIDHPGRVANIIWQTRAATPTAFENQLGDAFEQIFESGVVDVPGIVSRLNAEGPAHPDAGAWTDERFLALMRQLG